MWTWLQKLQGMWFKMMGIIILTSLALLLSIVLVLVEHRFTSHNNKEDKIRILLPGYNCGGCGFGSCDGMAKAMLEDINNYKKCKPLRGEELKKMEDYINSLNKK